MRKLFLLVVAFTAGVLTLAWINSRPARRPGSGGSTPHRPRPQRSSGAGDSLPKRRPASPRATPSGTSSATRKTSSPRAASATKPRRCAGTTASGKRCSREAQEGSRFCWQHG